MAAPTAKTIPTRHAVLPIKFAWAAIGTSPINIDWMPGDIALFTNTHATDPKTFTIVSNPKDSRSAVTIAAFSLAAGEFAVCPRFGDQDNSTLNVVGSSTDIKMARLSTHAQPT